MPEVAHGNAGGEVRMTSAKNIRTTDVADDLRSQIGSGVRGATTLIRAANGVGIGPAFPAINISAGGSDRDRKNAKKAAKLVRQAQKALDGRSARGAEKLFDEAIALLDNPPSQLWCYRLVAASKAANYEYVVNNYQRIRALVASEAEIAVVDRSWIDCLISAGFLHEALRELETLSVRSASSWETMATTLGVIHARLGNLGKAIAIQKEILAKEPSDVLARWNLSIHQLEAGELPEAFDNYEARWNWADFPSERRTFDIPRWSGESLDGKRILVWREQGVGDEIRFAGVLPDLIATGASITFESAAKLAPLFVKSFPDVEVRPEQPREKRRRDDYQGFDFEVPIGSLARHFRPSVAEMQAKCSPWLKRDAEIEAQVRSDIGAAPHQPVIGLCWRSSNQNLHRNQHYVKGEYLSPLKMLGAAKFICLQYDECSEEVGLMRELGLPLYDFPAIDQMNDLVSAAYLAGACDMVISAGTATAELSAGLGIPTVLFGLKHSQTQLGTDGVPWHPATRFLSLNPDEPIGVARSILFEWREISAWAEQACVSGRQVDWRLSFPGAA
ncbi:tetratricopeptide repeat protein [Mesorhizobium sp. 1M-11]|uniref:tetratricopeptide repeat protein n=1 Tax=Mesorhizobium sp. 1M-11 TaxID=1529006 RepID=UPI00128ED06D|nr:tetratricopeptide repeat protein [Mesorhizobium sp. 1M-11]